MEITQEQFDKMMEIPLRYKDSQRFLHCQKCVEPFLNSDAHKEISPREYGSYEVGALDFSYPNGDMAGIIVVWCKRCQRVVWDSRHLVPIMPK